jgi:3-hydroxybutyryl-CoA dehydrogenase
MDNSVTNICVVGAGNMGHQIALLCALAGIDVKCTDLSPSALKKAEDFASSYLDGRIEKGRLTSEQATVARAKMSFSTDLHQSARDADFIIEAVVEKVDVKRELFAQLDRAAPPHAILATNSSAIVSSMIANATRRPSQVLNMHFFNPALVMKLVEVAKGPHVSHETAEATMALSRRLGKTPVLVQREVEGFLLNRIILAIFREAQWLLEMGVATVEDIDAACVAGAGHPMGPFRLNDLTGLDLSYIMAIEKFQRTGDPAHLPPPSLAAKYSRGEYGEKSGKGWYEYK